MPFHTTDALILRTYKLGESDRLVVFLTRDRGKKRGVAKNARQSRRRFGGALEPLTHGRVGYMERERRDLVRLDYVELTRSPLSAVDGEALGYASYFAERKRSVVPYLTNLGADTPETIGARIVAEAARSPVGRSFSESEWRRW